MKHNLDILCYKLLKNVLNFLKIETSPRNPKDGFTEPLGSAEYSLGSAGLRAMNCPWDTV